MSAIGYYVILLFVTLVVFQNAGAEPKKLRVCYYVGSQDLTPSMLNATICTHIIFAFAQNRNNTLEPTNPEDVQLYKELVALKSLNSELKIMVSTGNGFSETSSTAENRETFAKSAVDFMKNYSLDGLDIDWEFPVSEDKENFVLLLKELHEQFENKSLELSAATANNELYINIGYDVKALGKYLTFMNVMCYDYHFYTFLTPYTGVNSPLYSRPDETPFFAKFNINFTINYYIELGMPASKIVVGVPTYGHTYTLLDAGKNGIDSPSVGPGTGGGWTTFPQMCLRMELGQYISLFDNYTMTPYAYAFSSKDWVSFDDLDSIRAKALWVKNSDLAGMMTFNLNSDDWIGSCAQITPNKFPLHRVIADTLEQ